MHFMNNSLNNIEHFELNYISNKDLSLWTKPDALRGSILIDNKLKQELIIGVNKVPYHILTGVVKMR